LSRAIKIRPQLAPEEVRSVRDILPLVIREQCGFRPEREGGIRIEKEWWNIKGKILNQNKDNRTEGNTLIVYNYGYVPCSTRVTVFFFLLIHVG
jgi:D-aspartate oxidase